MGSNYPVAYLILVLFYFLLLWFELYLSTFMCKGQTFVALQRSYPTSSCVQAPILLRVARHDIL